MVAFFDWLSARHVCECGTVYSIKTINSLVPSTDTVVCEHCGAVMDSWQIELAIAFMSSSADRLGDGGVCGTLAQCALVIREHKPEGRPP